MPKINKVFTLELTIAQFLRVCTDVELQALDIELVSELRRREANKARKRMINDFQRPPGGPIQSPSP